MIVLSIMDKNKLMSFDEFVDSLFDFATKNSEDNLSVTRDDGHVTIIKVIHLDGKVFIRMDDIDMGYFEEFNLRGYKCRFRQKNRTHIHIGLLPNESLMKSVCNNPFVLFQDA